MVLLGAVYDASPSDEQHWLEWKSTLDLTSKEVVATILSKAIIAFSNRDPAESARVVGGIGILLVGLEPGAVHGVTPVDNADLDQKICSYIGVDGPVWIPHWFTYQGKDVLIIEVQPPQWGDPIHVFRKDFDKIRDGQVYVRKHARSEPAVHADIARLADRRARSHVSEKLDIEVKAGYPQPLSRYIVADSDRDNYIKGERARLMRPLYDEQTRKRRSALSRAVLGDTFAAMTEMQRSISSMHSALTAPEDRTEEAYAAEVDAYLERLVAAWPEAIRSYAAGRIPAPVFSVVNHSSRNLRRLAIRLHVAGDADAQRYDKDWPTGSLPNLLPDPPRIWGPQTRLSFHTGFTVGGLRSSVYQPPIAPRTEIDHGGSFTLTFPAVDLRPHETEILDDMICVLIPSIRTEPVVATWTATATNIDARAEGQLTVLFDGPDVNIADLGRESR